jgi:glycosyltransferase involved in cell wall biosynthesis
MNILFPFSGESVGGSHISSALIAQNLSPDFKPLFVMSETSALQCALLEEHGLSSQTRTDLFVPRSLKELLLNFPRFLIALGKARAFLKANDIAFIHCDNGPAQYLWFYAGRLAGVPYLHVQRTPLRMTPERRFALKRARAVIANSVFTRATLPPLPANVIQAIIPPPVEFDSPAAAPAKGDKIVIGFLSNMQARKRPELFLEIAKILNGQAPGVFRFIMGGAFYEDYAERLKAMAYDFALEKHITFTGFVEKPEALLARFHILVAPAEDEAFGRVLVEAMSLGVPVMASNSGGHPEIIEEGKTGFLCPPGNAAAFVEKIQTLMSNEPLKAAITQAARTAAHAYRPAPVAARFEAIYRQILQGRTTV